MALPSLSLSERASGGGATTTVVVVVVVAAAAVPVATFRGGADAVVAETFRGDDGMVRERRDDVPVSCVFHRDNKA